MQLLPQFLVAVYVPFRQRIFKPIEAEFLNRATDAHRRRVVVSPCCVQHQRIVVADSLTYCGADLDVLLPGMWRMNLIGSPAKRFVVQRLLAILINSREGLGAGVDRYAVTVRPQELVNRHASGLSRQVPQRHIDGPDRPDQGCLLYTSPSPRDRQKSRMPSS